MTQVELTLVAALGSAGLTAIASLGVVWFQEWRRGKAASQADLVRAIETVLGKSMAIIQRACATLVNARDSIFRPQRPV